MAQSSKVLEWTFFHPKKSIWMDLGTHGSVQEALIDVGEMPDPYYGKNEEKFGWFEEHTWEFKSIFFVEQEDIDNSEYHELVFNSLDTYGKVFVNDSLVMKTENAYIPHSVQIKEFLVVGMNEVTVEITPPVMYHADSYKNGKYKLPAPNDVHETAIAPYTRKPQYQFGWDWALRLNTIGFNKPVELKSYSNNRIVNKSVNVWEVKEDKAKLELTVDFAVSTTGKKYLWKSEIFGTEEVEIKNGKATRIVELDNPKLWWPLGQGDQHLYNDIWSISEAEKSIASVSLNFGVKTSELIREEDQWGTSYYFKINGRRIFCKGANYIPQDIFPARVESDEIVSLIETMAETNFNMVRVWGGGYYPDDIFYETCDRLGIMVWQDLMFACAMYPGDDDFIANVSEEFQYQVPRIAGHPSVVQFNGNNEVEVAWGNWGFQIKYGLYGKSAREIEDAYIRLFKETAPKIIAQHTTIPYIHTSPLSNWGKMELYNHGSQHYWGVWHGKDPMEDFGKKIGRFNAEYGFQSFPEYSTIETFSTKEDWDLSSDVMKHHQKSYVGNDMILKHAKRLYGKPESFEDFIYYSQLTQSMAVSMAVAGHRIDAPRCGGTLYWQLNDCWPAPTWSSIDYYGNWKALQYRMRDDYREVAVVAKFNDLTDVDYYIVSGIDDEVNSKITCDVYDLKGKLVKSYDLSTNLSPQSSKQLEIPVLSEEKCRIGKGKKKKKNYHLKFTWTDGVNEYKRTYDELGKEYKVASEDVVEFRLENVNSEAGTAQLVIENKRFLKDCWVTSKNPGIKYDRNFVSLLPGIHTIQISFEKTPVEGDFQLKWL